MNGSKKIIFWVVIVMIIASIMTVCSRNESNDNLASYTQDNRVEVINDNNTDNDQEIETYIYTDNEHNFSLSIPKEWTQVKEGDSVTFVHTPTGVAVQVQVLDYYGSVNNTTAETISAEVLQAGYTYVNFNKVSNSQYEVVYQDYQNQTYDYLEEVYWDRENIVKLVFVTPDEYYDTMLPYFQTVMDSFVWSKASPIPDGYYLYYVDSIDMEILVPNGWVMGASGDAIVCMDEASGAQFTVTLSDYTGTLDSVTATDLVSLLRGNKSNFIMSQYNASETSVNAIATYLLDNIQITEHVYMYVNGQVMCTIMFDYEYGTIDESIPSTCGDYFRFLTMYFDSESEGSGQTDAGENTNTTFPLQPETIENNTNTDIEGSDETSEKSNS